MTRVEIVPGLCGGPEIRSTLKLMSPNATSSLPANAFVTSFHAGADEN